MTHIHVMASGIPVTCDGRICELIDRESPRYRADYRRLFYPEEFPSEPEPVSVIAAPVPVPPPPSVPQTMDLMLAGDVVEVVAKRIGAERFAKWIEAKTGINCGCASRKEALNRLSEKLLKWANLRP
jgi:hypothetical protein